MRDFASAINAIRPAYKRLVEMEPFSVDTVPFPAPAKPGVYSLSERGRPVYVGRARNLRNRLGNHRNKSVTAASLAVKIARIAAGRPATYTQGSSAKDLFRNDPAFSAEFHRARERIRAMQVRYVVEPDDIRQALLEIYAAVELDTILRSGAQAGQSGGFNSFRTS